MKNDVNELQHQATKALLLAEQKTREAARAWDSVVDAETELMNALEPGSTEHEMAARFIVIARQSANRVWLALGNSSKIDPPTETN
jgi:hypothetical protein